MSLTVGIRRVPSLALTVTCVCGLIATAGAGILQPLPSARTATVRIAAIRDGAVDLGKDFKVESFRAEDGQQDWASLFGYATGHRIPYGTYRATVYVPGFWGSAVGTVRVSEPDVLVVIDLRPAPQGTPRNNSNFGNE